MRWSTSEVQSPKTVPALNGFKYLFYYVCSDAVYAVSHLVVCFVYGRFWHHWLEHSHKVSDEFTLWHQSRRPIYPQFIPFMSGRGGVVPRYWSRSLQVRAPSPPLNWAYIRSIQIGSTEFRHICSCADAVGFHYETYSEIICILRHRWWAHHSTSHHHIKPEHLVKGLMCWDGHISPTTQLWCMYVFSRTNNYLKRQNQTDDWSVLERVTSRSAN